MVMYQVLCLAPYMLISSNPHKYPMKQMFHLHVTDKQSDTERQRDLPQATQWQGKDFNPEYCS